MPSRRETNQKEVPVSDDIMSSLRAKNNKCNWMARVVKADDRKYQREHGQSKNDIEEAFENDGIGELR